MIPSSNNFDTNQPSKGAAPTTSQPTKSVNSFAKAGLEKSTDIPSGDNTSGGVMGGDFQTFGNIFGQGEFGGLVHFKNRTDPPAIDHP